MAASLSHGKLVIISGPSGAGKSTLVELLLEQCDLPLSLSVSATTRPPRGDEKDGVAYHFLEKDEFNKLRDSGKFLEYKDVFDRGDWYGTLRDSVTSGLDGGDWVILEIDIQGAHAVLESVPDATTIFVHAGSIDELERRLIKRNTDTTESIHRRLQVARNEMSLAKDYQYEVENADPLTAMSEICTILKEVGEHTDAGRT